MKKGLFRIYIDLLCLLIVTFFVIIPALAEESLNLELVYPEKDAKIEAYSTFFVGNTNPEARLRINNERVKVYPNGGFVHVVDLNPGTNIVNVVATANGVSKTITAKIYTPKYETTLPKLPLKIDISSITPKDSIIYKTGDLIQVSFKGSTGNKAYFSIGNKRKNIPMIEQPPKYIKRKPIYGSSTISSFAPVKGIYKGTYRIKEKDIFANEPILVKLVSDRNKVDYKTSSYVLTISPDAPPAVAKVNTDYATVRTYPGKSRLTPLPEGTFITLTGKIGDNYRFEMGDSMNGWISEEDITLLPAGTPVLESSIDIIDIISNEDRVYIKIPLAQRLPVLINQLSPNEMEFKIFGTKANIDLFSYENKDNFLKEVKWLQETSDTVKISLKADAKQFWGYKYYYESDDTLVLEVRKPPIIDPEKPFRGITICLDPGHGGEEDGAKGPTGVPEKQVNLDIALKLEKMLREKGANVVMTRTSDEEVDLYDRVKYAASHDSVILLSIHNNSLPDGRNPYEDHGTSTYYYHSQSLPLAKILHKALLEDAGFKDFGIFWSSFVLTRPNEMLSVLLEIGFMINPEEYNRIIDAEFQEKIAKSITRGLEYFLFTNAEKPDYKLSEKK